MGENIRSLRTKEIQRGLKERYESRLLAALNSSRKIKVSPIGKMELVAPFPHDLNSIKRVRFFLEYLKSAITPDGSPDRDWDLLGLPSREESLNWVNRDLMRYRQYPCLVISGEKGALTTEMRFCEGDAWENDSIEAILWLLKEGQLFRLRKCACCMKWFYAIRDDQRFRSTACRQKEHRLSDVFKEKRARYMRERYRPLEKQAEARAKRQAAQVRGKAR